MRKGMAEEKKKLVIDSEMLQRIFKRSARRLMMLAAEGEAELLEVIHRKAAAQQDEGKEQLVVTFSHSITVDFGKNTQEDKLGGNIKVGMKVKADLDDTDEDLPGLWGNEEVEG